MRRFSNSTAGPATVRRWRRRCRTVALLIGGIALTLPATADEAFEPAVQAPLAARSLLLDVAVAGNRLVAVGERGHILLSDDGAASWRQVEVPTRATLTGVDFRDDRHGLAVGHDAVILRTTDGGDSWQRVHWAPEEETPFLDVWFWNDTEGVAIGAYGFFYETADGGDTWTSRWISEDDFHLHQIREAPSGVRYIAAEAGIIYRSDDGGESWRELPSPYAGSFFGVQPLDDEVVLLFGLRGHLFRSEDGGDSWTELDSGTVAMLTDGVVLPDGRIVVVGLGGAVLVSNDGGRNFSLNSRADRLGMSAAVVVSGGGVVVVGSGGARTLNTFE